jgi:hypothetical protein
MEVSRKQSLNTATTSFLTVPSMNQQGSVTEGMSNANESR